LADGRKSFLERYAGIESGRECERLAPALSAFVDGEADGAQVVDLRVHLRQCLACRAAVRGLHDASRPLTVVFPTAGLAVAAGGGAEQAHGLFARVYETVTMHMHERAANSFLRAQAIVDTVTAGKMAAAAASAAALAGSGVAVEGVLSGTPPATPQADHPARGQRVDDGVREAAGEDDHACQASIACASVQAWASPEATGDGHEHRAGGGHSASSEFGFEGP
jgi:putative zinc finger protein